MDNEDEACMQLRQRGFTLVEMLVTVVIVGILASIAVPAYQRYVARQRVSAGQADLVSLAMNLENYLQNNTQYPPAAEGIESIQKVLPGWTPTQGMDFNYSITAVDNKSAPPTYALQATGYSNMVAQCVIFLSSVGSRRMAACPSGASHW